MTITSRWGLLLAYFLGLVSTAVCTVPTPPAAESEREPAANRVNAPTPVNSQTAPAQSPVPSEPARAVVESPGQEPRVRIALKHEPGATLYYSIENEYREGGGVQPLLNYSTTLKEKRVVIQRVLPTASQPAQNDPRAARVEWEIDRYEVREKAMKEDAEFDSLRHLYPPPSLYNLGSVAGSKFTFTQLPDGAVSQVIAAPGQLQGEASRGMPSKTVEKCIVTVDNLTRQIHDVTALYLPPQQVGPGAVWRFEQVEHQRNVGKFTTRVVCTLRGLRMDGERQLATIDIGGEVSLLADKIIQPSPASRPGMPTSSPAKPREFKLDRGIIHGQVEFDVTHGELVEMTLRREQAVGAEIDGQSMGPMKLTTSMTHLMKTTASRIAPTKPIIVGGKKPPVMPKGMTAPPVTNPPRKAPTTTSGPAASPAVVRPPAPHRPYVPTSQPLPSRVGGKGARTSSRPYYDDAGLNPPSRPSTVVKEPGSATTQPSEAPDESTKESPATPSQAE